MNLRPSLARSNTVVVLLTAFWGFLRLAEFAETILPLTYVIPLLVCVWARRAWQNWAMAGVFTLFTFFKAARLESDGTPLTHAELVTLGATMLNIVIGAAIVHLLVEYRNRSDAQTVRILEQNTELAAQAGELVEQNEEIRTQSEELAQQNEEIHTQAEELVRQNDELHLSNGRLGIRERMLQDLLSSVRSPDDTALATVCQSALALIGTPADQIALLELEDAGHLKLSAQAANDGAGALPAVWPLERSLAGLILQDDRTAYLSDLATHPKLAAPFVPDGAVRSVLATPLRLGGRPVGILAVCSREPCHWTDEQFQLIEWAAAMCSHVAGSIRSRRALAARTQELEAANRAKDEFLAMLSHELRTPLTPVLAAAGALATDRRLPADTREDLTMIRRNVTIQSRLIDDLLDLTRIERRKLDLCLQPCAPGPLLRDAAAIVAPDLDAKEQTLVIRCDVGENWRISGDPARLQQVLWNLLQNATKFSPARTTIQFTARPLAGTPPRVEFAVEDEGPGVPREEIERIFRPFEQIRNGRRVGRETGLGLGLAIARAIVELHGGQLHVGPGAGGRGARFTVDLPLVPAGPGATEPPASRDSLSAPGPEALNILLVEDHADTGRVITQLLKGAGHDVVHTGTVADALARCARNRFNLVISDIGLPDESGLALMRKLRALQPDIPGICMTGYGMESDQQACFAAGFSEHLAKPVDVQRLHAAINRAARPAVRPTGA